MRIASLFFAVLAGCLGAVLALLGGSSIWFVILTYSLVGAIALVLSLVAAAYWRPPASASGSFVAQESP